MNFNDNIGKAFLIFEAFMILMYFLAGIYVMFTEKFAYIESAIRNIFGVFLIVYGFFRLVRFYTKLKNLNND